METTTYLPDPFVVNQNVAVVTDLWLQYKRKGRSDLMRVLHCSKSGLSQRMTGKTMFKPAEIAAISAYLGPSVDDLIWGRIPDPDGARVVALRPNSNGAVTQVISPCVISQAA